MRSTALCLAAVAALVGCNKGPGPESGPVPVTSTTVTPDRTGGSVDTITIPPRVVSAITAPSKESGTAVSRPSPEPPKSLADRPTDELLTELEKADQKEHMPLIVELASRPKDKAKILPAMMKLQVDGRYIVRVAAATARLALDPEKAAEYAPALGSALRFKHQNAEFGPIVEDSPELRKVQKVAVDGLVKVMERELKNEPPKGQLGVTGAALGALQNFPLEAGKAAVALVAKIAAQLANPNRVAALDVLKKWGSAN
ncbi:MAG TPA: hypothetical protein VKE40_19925 [Gemmataceae bacterium]|nr:hypothetical protein [Gemmataceae bacterium]